MPESLKEVKAHVVLDANWWHYPVVFHFQRLSHLVFQTIACFCCFLLTCHCRKISGWKRNMNDGCTCWCPVLWYLTMYPVDRVDFWGRASTASCKYSNRLKSGGFGALLSWTLNNQTNIYINPNSCRTLHCNNINNVTTTWEITAKPFGWIWVCMQNKWSKKKTNKTQQTGLCLVYIQSNND